MNPLATARQLWRLNKEGMLVVTDNRSMDPASAPITAEQADAAIREVVELDRLLDGEALAGTQAAPPSS